ncbi:MAG: hypothetical protein CVU96_04570 [Firmicutes bacterium HGW-Firmicutes-20]|nr:MAG: hypothetical protein CVU96_04570 [Firmicutes bacterium HGW-Firmicutes-20]PKM90723.1 MAG: hypothetical protein CVU85_00185 [Firmicutes bacterium HGW-Firmicutes-10]
MVLRIYPQFSLCGLNCVLCPRYNTEGASRCPGCGADGFSESHPVCSIMSCNKKKDNVAFCFECSSYPCIRYQNDEKDSFISYINRSKDMEMAKTDLDGYLEVLNEKSQMLRYLLENHNDGRSKNFYCLAVNLLEAEDLREAYQRIRESTDTVTTRSILTQIAKERGISISLRK